jgi:magnesium-transporting ATPase (P-type)
MPSAGFVVITFIAALLVIAPSVVLVLRGWRSNWLGRGITLAALALLVFLTWSAFNDTEAVDFESRAFSLYVMWGFTLYVGVAVYACVWVVRGFVKREHT